jgi:hypothetical protein
LLIALRSSDWRASYARNFCGCSGDCLLANTFGVLSRNRLDLRVKMGVATPLLAQKIDFFVTPKPEFVANSPRTGQARRNYSNKKLSFAFSPALFLSKIGHFTRSRSAHALRINSDLCEDGICDCGGITSTVCRARQRAGASSWY